MVGSGVVSPEDLSVGTLTSNVPSAMNDAETSKYVIKTVKQSMIDARLSSKSCSAPWPDLENLMEPPSQIENLGDVLSVGSARDLDLSGIVAVTNQIEDANRCLVCFDDQTIGVVHQIAKRDHAWNGDSKTQHR